jgi:hypothetical protein
MQRLFWLSTVAAACLVTPAFADSAPAVSKLNFTADLGGGAIDHKSLGYGQFSVAAPITHSTGFQVDATVGDWQGKAFQSATGHLFWRDPSEGLFGLYSEYLNTDEPKSTTFDQGTGITTYGVGSTLWRAAVEGEYYVGRASLEGRVGWESGTNGSHFYDRVNLAYYPTTNLRLAIGQISEADEGIGSLALEYQPSEQVGATFFAEAFDAHDIVSANAGVRFYFGAGSKSLIDRHREDDPTINLPEDLIGIAHAVKHNTVQTCHDFEGILISCQPSD